MRGGATGLVTALLLVLALPSAGVAQGPLPVGEADGVRIVRERGALVVVFTKRAEKLRRKAAGRMVSVLCTEFLPDGTSSGGVIQRAPRRGRRIETGDLTRGMDYCRVWLAARTVTRNGERQRRGRELVVSIPLTQAGAVFLDEQEKALSILSLLTIAALLGEDRNISGYLTPTELFEAAPGFRPGPARPLVVPLASPSDTPQGSAAGYYSDGDRHVAGVIVSASGRRLFVEYEGEVLHTNVAGYMFGGID
jgi:hypothetical protein